MKGNLILEVKFQKIGSRIKYTLPVKMFCEKQDCEIPHTKTLDKNDNVIKTWLGDTNRMFKYNNTIYKKVCLNLIYDKCDKPKVNK